MIILRGHPQAEQIGSPFFANLGRQDDIAKRFGHRPALLVERPTVREHPPIRRALANPNADQQRAVEPAAILVRALQIHVRRPRQFGIGFARRTKHGKVRRSGVKPDVENIALLAPLCAAAIAGGASRKQFFGGMRVPGVRAFFFKPANHLPKRGEILQPLAAFITIENHQRHAPDALPRNAPVGTMRDHLVNAFLAPLGRPFHFRNLR